MWATLRALLYTAVEDDLIAGNPATRLGCRLRLASPTRVLGEKVKALTRDELRRFLAAAEHEPTYYPFFLTMARTEMRIGEALALQWPDVDEDARGGRV